MKYVSIITGSDLRMVMGVNYFIQSFISCNGFFKNITINRVYSGSQQLNIDNGDSMPIGSDIGTTEYKIRRGFRTFIRKVLTDKLYPLALLRSEYTLRTVSKRALSRFFSDDSPCDYVAFQEIGVAYFYFKSSAYKNSPKNNVKTILIVHSEDDSGKSILVNFRGYGYRDMQQRLVKRRDFVYEHIDNVIYISRKAYDNSILPAGKRAYVYNGSPIIDYAFRDKKQSGKIQFVCVGSITGNKGQDLILEAMKMMENDFLDKMHMSFVGGGCKFEETKSLAKKYDLDNYVSFLGIRNDVAGILAEMDVFIMPSKSEGLPMSAIEALRAGLFLILTDTGGCAEMCEEGCGCVCLRDPSDILEKMKAVVLNRVVSVPQKKRSHQRFLNSFSLESMAKGYEKVMESI